MGDLRVKMGFSFRQFLVLGTAAFALLIAGSAVAYQLVTASISVHLETSGCPSIGKEDAPIVIVLFEDFRCTGCRTFNEQVLPKIQLKYIDSGYVKFVLVPLAFLRGSKPLANAALSVYHTAPDRFILYVHELFQSYDGSGLQKLLEIAEKVGGIDLVKLESCIATHFYDLDLEKNFEMAKEVMGRDFGTPALYVNGVETSTASFEAVKTRIEKTIRQGHP